MKTCNRCKISKEATPEYFTRHKGTKDGLYSLCKECTRKRDRERQSERTLYIRERKKRDPEYRERFRKRYKQSRERFKKKLKEDDALAESYRENRRRHYKKYRKQNPETFRQATKRYAQKNPDKIKKIWKTGYEVRKAIEKGTLIRPDSCEWCGENHKNIDAAHYDYSKPLDVKWLCRPCHFKWDTEKPKIN